ncbi:MAG: relaxase/mobilization nuclease domain-containing protein [Holophagales bacterium]|nr:MAG: relaxase/mobilization nuclease domain-containing protein [Holophagales bacterium]
MIQSIHKGKGFRGVLNYVFGRAKSPELVGGNMYGTDPRALAQEFGEWRELRPGLTRAVFHSSLSLPHGPGGREELTDAQWRDVVERYLEHLGYGRSPFVVVRHRDTDHDHVHIVAARIGADGRAVSDSHDYRRGEEVLRQLEREYGLTQVKSAHEVEKSALRAGEVRHLERTGEVSVRLRLQDLLDRAAADRPTMSTFLERLRAAGVEAVPRVATTGHVSGISYGLDGVSFRGSALGRPYSWRGLQERLGVDYRPDRDLAAVRVAAGASLESSRSSSPWSPSSLEALQKELRALPTNGRRSVVARAASELSRRHGGALASAADAAHLAHALRSPRAAARLAVRHAPGLSVVAPVLDLASAARSPLGLLLYGARLATSAGRLALPALARSDGPTPLSRSVTAAYVRAAATGGPSMSRFLDRLEAAGVRPLPLVGRSGEVRAIAYRLGNEVIPGQDLGPAFTWTGVQQRLGVSYEPTRDLPRLRAIRERPSAERGGATEPDGPGRPGRAPGRAHGDEPEARSARASEPGPPAHRPRDTVERAPGSADVGRGVGTGSRTPDARPDHAGPARLGAGAAPARGAAARGEALPLPSANGGVRAARGPEVALGGSATDERLAAAALRESLRRTGTPELSTYHRHPAYAPNLERADTAWATAALRRGVEPHVVLREVAERGARATASKEATLAHGTRVVARALATVQPGRAVEKTVSLTVQALATAVKAPIAVVKALLIIRTIARELSQERGR